MDEFEIFGHNEYGRPGSFEEFMHLIHDQVEERGMSFEDAIGLIIDMIKPGNSENSHDVKPIFVGALWAYGYPEVAGCFGSIYLNTMPWGVGFSIAVEKDFEYGALTFEAQRAISQSLCIVLRIGSIEAEVDAENRIILEGPGGVSTNVAVEDIVSQFRAQVDETLGPDGPEPDDPMKRWLP